MKDKQYQSAGPAPGLPLISPILHVVSMTGLVFLRSSFGYAFLSPKSIFLALIWAHGLFSFYAWHQPGAWPHWSAVALYGLMVAGLYGIHLLKAFGRELRRTGEHDYFAGKSHFMRLAALFRTEAREKIQQFVHLWLEPAMVLMAGVFLGVAGVPALPAWLSFLALCLWAKEAINYWYRLRFQKKQGDVFADAGEGLDHEEENQPPAPSGAGRKPRQKRPRAAAVPSAGSPAETDRYAEILRLLPPYTLEQAENNYRTLLKACQPGAGGSGSDAAARMAQLGEAVGYFRKRFSGDRS